MLTHWSPLVQNIDLFPSYLPFKFSVSIVVLSFTLIIVPLQFNCTSDFWMHVRLWDFPKRSHLAVCCFEEKPINLYKYMWYLKMLAIFFDLFVFKYLCNSWFYQTFLLAGLQNTKFGLLSVEVGWSTVFKLQWFWKGANGYFSWQLLRQNSNERHCGSQ